uniref:Uncharacterized protein n=1 Tax=Anguilla anguilla TaxID=7936 RepID=A0A0E9PZV8_ANGAN
MLQEAPSSALLNDTCILYRTGLFGCSAHTVPV